MSRSDTLRFTALAALSASLPLAGCFDMATPFDDAGPGPEADASLNDDDAEPPADGVDAWTWTTAAAGLPPGLGGELASVRILAVADDDVVLCIGDPVAQTGGLARFDGSSLAVELEGFRCGGVRATADGAVVAHGIDLDERAAAIVGRRGAGWVREPVDGADGCGFELAHATAGGTTMVTAVCGGGERRLLARQGEAWAPSDAWVPSRVELPDLGGAFVASGAVVYYGFGGLAAGAEGADLGYPLDRATFAAGDDLERLVAVAHDRLLVREGGDWAHVASCPEAFADPELGSCWSVGAALSPEGGVLLAGGVRPGDGLARDWRLEWWDGAALHRVLEPCGGAAPSCGVDDLSVTAERVWAAVRVGSERRLLWAPRPDRT